MSIPFFSSVFSFVIHPPPLYPDLGDDDGADAAPGSEDNKKRLLARSKNRIHAQVVRPHRLARYDVWALRRFPFATIFISTPLQESRARKKVWLDDLKLSVNKMKGVLDTKEKQIHDMKAELETYRKEKQEFIEDRAALQKLFQTASKAAMGVGMMIDHLSF